MGEEIKSVIYCPECDEVLYEMPISRDKIGGIYLRLSKNIICSHKNSLPEHNPSIFTLSEDKTKLLPWEETTFLIDGRKYQSKTPIIFLYK